MLYRLSFSFAVIFLLSTISSLADVLHLQGGGTVEGTFVGGDSRTVRFLRQDGQLESFAITDVESIVFGTPAAAVSTPPPSSPSDPHTVPKGTVLVIRMIDPVDSNVNQPGETFRATLEEPVTVAGEILAPKGTFASVQLVHVKQSGQLRGQEEIALQLRSITVNDKTYSLASEFATVASEGKGEETAKVVGGAAVIGALIGALTGGKKGAAVGAAAGAGAGVAVQAVRGKQVRVPSEALLAFSLEEAVTLH